MSSVLRIHHNGIPPYVYVDVDVARRLPVAAPCGGAGMKLLLARRVWLCEDLFLLFFLTDCPYVARSDAGGGVW